MMPFSDAQTYMQREAQDTTTSGLTFLKLMYNMGYLEILSIFGRQQTEIESLTDLVAAQRGYQVPSDCLWPKTLELIDGTTLTPLIEVADDKAWTLMKSGNVQGRPTHFHYRPRFGLGGGVLELYPIPSSSTYDLRMFYEAADKSLTKADYDTGTVSINSGSANVTGSGTTFAADMVGRYLKLTDDGTDRLWYRIKTFTSTTAIVLENVYEGSSNASGVAYVISEMPALPPDMHILPAYYALMHWWSTKKDAQKTKQFTDWYNLGMRRARKVHATVVRDGIINQEMPLLPFAIYPPHFPTSIDA